MDWIFGRSTTARSRNCSPRPAALTPSEVLSASGWVRHGLRDKKADDGKTKDLMAEASVRRRPATTQTINQRTAYFEIAIANPKGR